MYEIKFSFYRKENLLSLNETKEIYTLFECLNAYSIFKTYFIPFSINAVFK